MCLTTIHMHWGTSKRSTFRTIWLFVTFAIRFTRTFIRETSTGPGNMALQEQWLDKKCWWKELNYLIPNQLKKSEPSFCFHFNLFSFPIIKNYFANFAVMYNKQIVVRNGRYLCKTCCRPFWYRSNATKHYITKHLFKDKGEFGKLFNIYLQRNRLGDQKHGNSEITID